MSPTPKQELARRIRARSLPTPSGCWQWQGKVSGGRYRYGYMKVTDADGVMREKRAHRVAYEALVGPIPAGLVLDHLCRNTLCVNPAHVEPVTNAENVRRGFGPSAQNARKSHCIRGHEFTPENIRWLVRDSRPNPSRICKECDRQYNAARPPRKRAS